MGVTLMGDEPFGGEKGFAVRSGAQRQIVEAGHTHSPSKKKEPAPRGAPGIGLLADHREPVAGLVVGAHVNGFYAAAGGPGNWLLVQRDHQQFILGDAQGLPSTSSHEVARAGSIWKVLS